MTGGEAYTHLVDAIEAIVIPSAETVRDEDRFVHIEPMKDQPVVDRQFAVLPQRPVYDKEAHRTGGYGATSKPARIEVTVQVFYAIGPGWGSLFYDDNEQVLQAMRLLANGSISQLRNVLIDEGSVDYQYPEGGDVPVGCVAAWNVTIEYDRREAS